MQSLLLDIVEQVKPLIGKGKVADYIPALAEVAPKHFGIAVFDVSGHLFKAGDADTPFSIQSISKILTEYLPSTENNIKVLTRYFQSTYQGLTILSS